MSNRNEKLLLGDIIESATNIFKYTNDLTFEEFVGDQKTIDAVIRNFEIIGEASNRLPDEFREMHNQVDWYRIRGFRNRIVHDYFGIDFQIVWSIKENYLKSLLEIIQTIHDRI